MRVIKSTVLLGLLFAATAVITGCQASGDSGASLQTQEIRQSAEGDFRIYKSPT